MPELPEVETIARQLRKLGVEGRTIRSVKVGWARTVEPLSVPEFSRQVCGAEIGRILRVGKWLMLSLDSGKTIMIHLRMAGGFSTAPGIHDRIVLELSGGLVLHYRDTRKFGRWRLVNDPEEILWRLGPDALTRGFSLRYFRAALGKRHRMVKPLLLDQTFVAGLGNIYADEVLWRTRIHPVRLSDSLSASETEALFKAIKHVLRAAVKNRGTSLGTGRSNYRDVEGRSGGNRTGVKAYGRAGRPCERCGVHLEKLIIGQRTTTFCPNCQRVAEH